MRFLHDGQISFAICGASPCSHAKVVQLWSSLNKTRGVTFLWWYVLCLSCTEGHLAIMDLRFRPCCPPPHQLLPKHAWYLAAQCEIPPPLSRNTIFIGGYRASIAEIPLFRGGIAPPLRMLSPGETLRKGGGGIAPNWPC